ncbi:MAG: alpha/beta hydrolase [Acidimicrobiia bacterium]
MDADPRPEDAEAGNPRLEDAEAGDQLVADIEADDPPHREPDAPLESSESAEPEPPERWRRLRWVFTRRLCFGGLAGALVFFLASTTPSLVPRSWLFQGIVSGVSVAIGYGLGSAVSAGIRKVRNDEPSAHAKKNAWRVLLAASIVIGAAALFLGAEWQQDVRSLMNMDQLKVYEWGFILVVGLVLAGFILAVARLIRGFGRVVIRFLDRFMPRVAAVIGGVTIVVLVLIGLVQGLLFDPMVAALNQSYALIDKGTSPGISQPDSALRSGSTESLVEWDTLGIKGRDFTGDGGGPSPDDIEAYTGEPAEQPIRVYVGLKSADSLDQRVDLAMDELERTGAFDRSVVAVMTKTGTGWVDENVADSLEFMWGGDTAEVGMQYSYLPSWVSFLVDKSKAADAGRELIGAVSDHISAMPEDDRPTLVVFGESLGSYGTESAFEDLDDLRSRVDGAMLVGPTFTNPLHGELTDSRDEGSPVWRPIVDGGASVRFAVAPGDLKDGALTGTEEWESPRVVYLQNSSDPITYFDPAVLWAPPRWLDGERGPDISRGMTWFPVVTFWQIAADMAFSMGVPAGHGHRYGSNVAAGWAAIVPPDGWTDTDTDDLRDLIDQRADERDRRKESAG